VKYIKQLFNYRKLWKHQKNRNKRLTKKVNKLSTSLAEDLKLDVTNDEIRKLKQQVQALKNQVKQLNLEAQKYFDLLMVKELKDSDD
jgi:chromosome segregation ATPase